MSEEKLKFYNPDDVELYIGDKKVSFSDFEKSMASVNPHWDKQQGSTQQCSSTKKHRDWCNWKMNPSIGNEETFCNCDAGHKD